MRSDHGGAVINLYDAESGAPVGSISDEQLQFLMEELEEESLEDRDYYLTPDTVDMLESDGADMELVNVLRSALAGREGMDVRWSRS